MASVTFHFSSSLSRVPASSGETLDIGQMTPAIISHED